MTEKEIDSGTFRPVGLADRISGHADLPAQEKIFSEIICSKPKRSLHGSVFYWVFRTRCMCRADAARCGNLDGAVVRSRILYKIRNHSRIYLTNKIPLISLYLLACRQFVIAKPVAT